MGPHVFFPFFFLSAHAHLPLDLYSLWHNNIGDNGATVIGKALKHNTGLTDLLCGAGTP